MVARRPTKAELLARYSALVATDPSAAYKLVTGANLRAKDLLAAAERAQILAAREFQVVVFVGRDPREDRGVVRDRLYDVRAGFTTLAAARAAAASLPRDPYGRRPIIRAIVGGCPVGITVEEDFEP